MELQFTNSLLTQMSSDDIGKLNTHVRQTMTYHVIFAIERTYCVNTRLTHGIQVSSITCITNKRYHIVCKAIINRFMGDIVTRLLAATSFPMILRARLLSKYRRGLRCNILAAEGTKLYSGAKF